MPIWNGNNCSQEFIKESDSYSLYIFQESVKLPKAENDPCPPYGTFFFCHWVYTQPAARAAQNFFFVP